MKADKTISVSMFGLLQTLRKERGLPYNIELPLPEEGRPALDIARELDLPVEKIEAIFCNHVTKDLNHIIHPGDRIAFVPRGVPGPYRFLLGIHENGRRKKQTD